MKSSGKPPRGRNRGKFHQNQNESHRINHKIKVPEVRLVTEDGEQLGVQTTKAALEIAQDRGLDLVEVAPNAKPPVCKLMDYGKFKYREQKKQTEAKKKRTEITVKEIRIRYRTDIGDFNTKIEKAREFISKGDKVKFTMQFRGREIAYLSLGMDKFKEVATALEDIAEVDDQSPKPGRQIFVTFVPLKTKPNA